MKNATNWETMVGKESYIEIKTKNGIEVKRLVVTKVGNGNQLEIDLQPMTKESWQKRWNNIPMTDDTSQNIKNMNQCSKEFKSLK